MHERPLVLAPHEIGQRAQGERDSADAEVGGHNHLRPRPGDELVDLRDGHRPELADRDEHYVGPAELIHHLLGGQVAEAPAEGDRHPVHLEGVDGVRTPLGPALGVGEGRHTLELEPSGVLPAEGPDEIAVDALHGAEGVAVVGVVGAQHDVRRRLRRPYAYGLPVMGVDHQAVRGVRELVAGVAVPSYEHGGRMSRDHFTLSARPGRY